MVLLTALRPSIGVRVSVAPREVAAAQDGSPLVQAIANAVLEHGVVVRHVTCPYSYS
jgi:hypothetical protein